MRHVLKSLLVILLYTTVLILHGQETSMATRKTTKELDSIPPAIELLLKEVVVSATKTKMQLGSTTVPVTLIKSEAIDRSNSLRLKDILAEITGMNMVASALGTGIQMQGLDSDYTLIMIDGVPIIGRLNGTIDLARLTVDNIDRIEIVKGPSSVLFGSNAIAGVINIITKSTQDNKSLDVRLKNSSFQTQNYALGGTVSKKKYQARASINFYKTGGYDLASNYQGYNISTNYYGKTVSPHTNYSLSLHQRYQFSPKVKMHLDGRYFDERVTYKFINSENSLIAGRGVLTDWSIRPWITVQISSKLKSKLSFSHNLYKTFTEENYLENSTLFSQSFFKETYTVIASQNDYKFNDNHALTLGGGYEKESIQTNRLYDDRAQVADNKFLYLQYLYKFKNKFDLVVGTRLENHQNYLNQFNPKVSFRYEINPKYVVKASVGRGFKKPDFKQLYFNYTNNAIGYTVLGTTYVEEGMQHLLEANDIVINPTSGAPVIYDLYSDILENDGKIDAESSIGYNFGLSIRSLNNTIIDLNVFRNDLKNLIETTPIALKTNGWQVYSYQNINRVLTQGIEVDIKYFLSDKTTINFGYQYLKAKDKKIVDSIKEGQIFGVNLETGSSYKVSLDQYGGLLNRPQHSANLKIGFKEIWKGINADIRVLYHGKYGFADLNNNQILDIEKEYVPHYFLINATLSKALRKEKIRLKLGIDNLTNYTYSTPEFTISSLPGRIYYISLIFKINKK